MFVESEAMNPKVLKLSSLAEHRARPPITGIRESFTRGPVTSPSGKRINHHYRKLPTINIYLKLYDCSGKMI
jgi:hypothetical protein